MTDAVARWETGLRPTSTQVLELDVEDLQRRLDAAIRERDAHAAEVRRLRDGNVKLDEANCALHGRIGELEEMVRKLQLLWVNQ